MKFLKIRFEYHDFSDTSWIHINSSYVTQLSEQRSLIPLFFLAHQNYSLVGEKKILATKLFADKTDGIFT